MWARVSTFEGSPETVNDSVTYAKEEVLPQVRRIPGYRGVYGLLDRQTGRSLSITLWDSEEALRASEAEADRLREDSADTAGEAIVAVERYEVAFHEVADGPDA